MPKGAPTGEMVRNFPSPTSTFHLGGQGRARGALLFAASAFSFAPPASAEITWPAEQLLPSFPVPEATQDLILLRGPESTAPELTLFASLKGIVNRTKPRIFSYEGDEFAEGRYTWLESLELKWVEHSDKYSLLTKYKNEISGLIVYDPDVAATMNLATTLAGQEGALVVAPSLLTTLTQAPYSFPIIDDLRGDFDSTVAVYDYLYEEIWPSLDHRAIAGLSPQFHKASLREYAVALGMAVIWLDPKVPAESEVLDRFLGDMPAGAVYMGWWPEEGAGVERASTHGIATVASDYATNLTVHGGMDRTVAVQPIPPKPILENKIYVAFILSDGDNLQYVEHLMRKLWNNPDRGNVPIGWTVSPAMLDAMPGALNYYFESATPSDNLISGPSGYGYNYPNYYPEGTSLAEFAAKTDDYATRAGLRVVTVWNTIVGGIDPDAGETFAVHAPSILGLTAQNTGGGLTIYGASLPSFALSCNYCTNEEAMKEHIASAAAGFDGSAPRFILIQAQPWQGVTPTSFMNVQNSLGTEYAVVRPDNWFQLLRQSEGLPIEPVLPISSGVYRLINKASGLCVTLGTAPEGDIPLMQSECADTDDQRWTVTPTSNGYVKLASLSNPSLIVDVAGGPSAVEEGHPTIVHQDLGGSNQEWQPIWEADQDYHLLARHSDRCLDVPNAVATPVQLRQWTCNGSAAQAYRFADPIWPPITDDPVDPVGPGVVEEPPVDPIPGGTGGAPSVPSGGESPPDEDEAAPAGCSCAGAAGRPGGSGPLLLGLSLFLALKLRRRDPRAA